MGFSNIYRCGPFERGMKYDELWGLKTEKKQTPKKGTASVAKQKYPSDIRVWKVLARSKKQEGVATEKEKNQWDGILGVPEILGPS